MQTKSSNNGNGHQMAHASPNVNPILKRRIEDLKADAKIKYNVKVVVNQDERKAKQAQEFHVCYMFLHNHTKWKPRYPSEDGRTIAWAHLSKPSLDWTPARADDFLKTANGSNVKRSSDGTKWLPGFQPERHATVRCMAAFLKRFGVAKEAAPGKTGCAEPCLCGGKASHHVTGDACDLGGLDHLSKVLDARGGLGKPGHRLDDYLRTFGLWRPLAHKPKKTREEWHVERLSDKQRLRLENVGSHPKVNADYKAILVRHHFHSEATEHCRHPDHK